MGKYPWSDQQEQRRNERRSKGIRPVSKKREKINREYRRIVAEMAAAENRCRVRSPECTGVVQGANHIQKRSPGNLIDRDNLEMCCNSCNGYIERFPEWAKQNGHFKSRFAK
jgi:hypothetical protein